MGGTLAILAFQTVLQFLLSALQGRRPVSLTQTASRLSRVGVAWLVPGDGVAEELKLFTTSH
jgi:hypothetical protein